MNHITENGSFGRTHVGDYEIASIRYLGEPGYDSTSADKKPTLPTSASSPMVTIRFTNGGVAQFRASGTEPKFKYYMELPGAPGVDRKTVEQDCKTWSETVLQELLRPDELGLQRPGL
uniref:Alpha-D-phosphohexomutase C-terminal domain-containing protein n=2 Tax=Entomoneis paludosa TaxID=265537 RepID=A0A7S2Y5P7_9STRA